MARHFKKIVEEVGMQLGQQNQPNIRQQLQMNIREFADKVAAFNKLGETLYNGGNFAQLAEELENITTQAEAYTLKETNGDWFDGVTVKRNMKELRGYSSEFKKVASEARALQERMTALYEDCGRVLGRYFEIKEFNQPDAMTTEPQAGERELQVNPRAGIREGQMCEKCGKTMEMCECGMNEGGPGSGIKGHKSGDSVMQKATNQAAAKANKKVTAMGDKARSDLAKAEIERNAKRSAEVAARRARKSLGEGSIKLKNLMEDVNSDYPGEDWVKLDVPMLKYEVALDFEKDLKKKGFEVKRHDWKERAAQGEEFSEFFVKKDDFDEANQYAVGAYPSYDNNARMEKE